MHPIQEKLLSLTEHHNLGAMKLREIGKLIDGPNSPQNIKHHLQQLAKKGLIKIDKRNKKIERIRAGKNKLSGLISIPILGSANCGEATLFAVENPEGYLQVSPRILGSKYLKKTRELFALKAVGPSMNRANIDGDSIEDGDYVIADRSQQMPKNGDRVVSIIDNAANIKRFFRDERKQQIMLVSESSLDISPIYIHQDDLQNYLVNGVVVLVMKNPNEDLKGFLQTGTSDIHRQLGPEPKEDYDYYMSLSKKNA